MNKLYRKIKGAISWGIGVPAGILAMLSINGELLWLPVLCGSIVMAIMAWNGYFTSAIHTAAKWVKEELI